MRTIRPSAASSHRSLDRDGRGLLHFIGRNQPVPLNPWIRKRIFPGAYPPTLREVFERVLEPQDLSVLDVENLRLHYAKTLEHWRRGFDDASGRGRARCSTRPSSAPGGSIWPARRPRSRPVAMQLFQVVFARGSSNAIPWTRVNG